jgi:protease I
MKRILFIISADGYQDVEYGEARKALEDAGHEVMVASTERVATGKFGGKAEADYLLEEVDPADFDAIVFIGGPGSHDFFEDARAHSLAKIFLDSEKITAAICAAPSILANAGLLVGVRATCFESQAENLKSRGAIVTGSPVEQVGFIITADGPSSARAFGEKIALALE